jgi:ABC-type multidrug transport system fused ATPase/permease subunit
MAELFVQNTVKLLQKESKTVIVIAHRLSTINLAQRIIVLDKGQVVQDGSFVELSVTEGPFRSMWQHQTLEVIEPIQN